MWVEEIRCGWTLMKAKKATKVLNITVYDLLVESTKA